MLGTVRGIQSPQERRKALGLMWKVDCLNSAHFYQGGMRLKVCQLLTLACSDEDGAKLLP